MAEEKTTAERAPFQGRTTILHRGMTALVVSVLELRMEY
jgi:hypothetical protein